MRKNRAMKKPLKKQESITTTIRLPIEIHREIKESARIAGHPMNVEVIARLAAHPKGTTLGDIARQNVKTQQMVQQIIDAISPRK